MNSQIIIFYHSRFVEWKYAQINDSEICKFKYSNFLSPQS